MTTKVNDQDFDAAWDEVILADIPDAKAAPAAEAKEAANPEDDAAAKAVAEQEKKDADKKAADEAAAAEANKGKTPEQLAAEKTAAEAAAKAAEVKAAQDAEAQDIERRVRVEAEAKAKLAQETAERTAKAEAERKQQEELTAQVKPYEMSKEETAAMEALKKDFPETYASLEATRKAERQHFSGELSKAVKAITEQVAKAVQPLGTAFEQQAQENFSKAVLTAHADFEEVMPLLPDWIGKQPSFLKAAYQRVYDQGSAQELVDMTTRFKQETGRVAAAPKPKEEEKPLIDPTELESGRPVRSKNAVPAPRGGKDVNDYDGAFAEAAGK